MGNSEKRSYKRVTNQFNVRIAKEISFNLFKDILLNKAESINISAAGILVHIKEIMEKGQHVRITFLQPNTFEFFEGKGEVVRIDADLNEGYIAAINFIELSDADLRRLDYYITLCQ